MTTSLMSWIVVLAAGAPLGAQSAPQARPEAPVPLESVDSVEADPIRCWWRTSAAAVRVGEAFSLVLTCAVVENDTTIVVADQSRLEPSAMQLPPFDVVGGQRGPDLRSDQRRFFQYQYQLRLINTDLFGKDVRIPSVAVGYHVESRVQRGESVRGRDRTYIMPTESVRVVSLVPTDATDIRDAPAWTFGEIEAHRFRARVLSVAASLLFAAAALVVLVAIVRLARRAREGRGARRRLLSDGAILRGVGRELSAVRRASEREGWSHDLVGRALAAVRIAGSLAIHRPAGQAAAGAGPAAPGQVPMRGGWIWGRKALVSGSATADALARELASDAGLSAARRESLDALQNAMARLTAARFARDETLDAASLNESVIDSVQALRRLKFESLWPVRKIKSATEFAAELGNRAWSR